MNPGVAVSVGPFKGETAEGFQDDQILSTVHDAVVHSGAEGVNVLSAGPDRVTSVTIPVPIPALMVLPSVQTVSI